MTSLSSLSKGLGAVGCAAAVAALSGAAGALSGDWTMAALGAAYLAGLGVGFWKDQKEIAKQWKVARVFEPNMSVDKRESLYGGWKRAVERSFNWARE